MQQAARRRALKSQERAHVVYARSVSPLAARPRYWNFVTSVRSNTEGGFGALASVHFWYSV